MNFLGFIHSARKEQTAKNKRQNQEDDHSDQILRAAAAVSVEIKKSPRQNERNYSQ